MYIEVQSPIHDGRANYLPRLTVPAPFYFGKQKRFGMFDAVHGLFLKGSFEINFETDWNSHGPLSWITVCFVNLFRDQLRGWQSVAVPHMQTLHGVSRRSYDAFSYASIFKRDEECRERELLPLN